MERYTRLMEEKDDTELSLSQKKKLARWLTSEATKAVSNLYSDQKLRELQRTVLGDSTDSKQLKLINEVANDMIGEFKKHIKRAGEFN